MNSLSSPSGWRAANRFSVSRLVQWTLPRRYHEIMAKMKQVALLPIFSKVSPRTVDDPGTWVEHTGVRSAQLKLLLEAVAASEALPHAIVEIGSFRGMTTRALAGATAREVVAVDPYVGDGGHVKDLSFFEEHTKGLTNISMIRQPSDLAFEEWGSKPVSLVFIDAIHEYVHAWYDFAAWGSLVPVGGFVAFHDVDQFPGVNRVCQKILSDMPEWKPWAYAPNIAIFQRQ